MGWPNDAIWQSDLARSANPDRLPEEASREIALIWELFNIDFTRPVNTDFGPTSTNVRTPISNRFSISFLKSTGYNSCSPSIFLA